MTIREAIVALDTLRPNMFTVPEKLAWLSELDGLIWQDVLRMRQRPAVPDFSPFPNPLDADGNFVFPPAVPEADDGVWNGEDTGEQGHVVYTDFTDENGDELLLLVPFPYDREIYVNYLMMQVDQANGETEKYNQSSRLFNTGLLNYRNYVNRQRTPTPTPGTARFWW